MSVRQSDKNVMTDIFFGDQKLVYDAEGNDLYYSLIEGDMWAYNPLVSTRNSESRVLIGIVNDRITYDSVASNSRIKMIVYDDSRYYLCHLVCTTLPLVSIECQAEVTTEETQMKVSLFDNRKDSNIRVVDSEGMIKVRGATSSRYPKKSFKLSLRDGEKKKDLSLLGMRSDDDWILYSCYADYERVRNVFSQNLWTESCGKDNAYRLNTGSYYKYVEVFLNGEYYGLYALGYRTDLKTLGIDKVGDDEGLFQKIAYGLFEFESDQPLDIMFDYLCSVEEHADDRQYLMSCVDLDNAADFFLYRTLIQGWDNFDKNYLVLLKHFYDGKKAIFIPWDMDLSWGDMWNETQRNCISFYELTPDYNSFSYDTSFSQLLLNNDEETYDLMYSKYKYNRKHGWSEERIDILLDGIEQDLFASGAYYRDCERWPESGTVEGMKSLDTFREYVHDRLHEMDDYIERLKNDHSTNPLLTQLLQYKDLNDYRFVISTQYPEMLEDPMYSEFIDFVGKDKVTIEADVNLDEYRLINVYSINISERDVKVYAISGNRCDMLYPDDCCRFRIEESNITTLSRWLRCLDNVYGNILLQINEMDKLDIDKEHFLEEFDVDCGSFGSVQEILEENNTLVFLLNCDSRKGYYIEDAYASGNLVTTGIGDWLYYEGDENYGIYIGGEESMVEPLGSQLGYNIRITEYTTDWKNIICDYSE
ncbi:CotH kinase family protein [Butyrivibrio sp. CB08]|uniref:CotH kinase family protein n=1 Tax=Butyrivibrio sp. CB08 TaxID=2364879 RepID=UPI001314833D|nr:CotH kinase family protein [Butyrivibrio sp. CB08]